LSEGKGTMRAAIYARVSTVRKSPEMQLREMREYRDRRGWTVAGEYENRHTSGTFVAREYDERGLQRGPRLKSNLEHPTPSVHTQATRRAYCEGTWAE
jgi:Resolvase, N terminal domain